MKSKFLTANNKIVVSFIVLTALLVFTTFLVGTVQKNSARRNEIALQKDKLTNQILSIKVGIAESMLPAYSYLIRSNPEQKKEFRALNREVRDKFSNLRSTNHFEEIDRRLIQESLRQFNRLDRIESEIFDLTGKDIIKYGPDRIEDMRVYQNSIIRKLQQLSILEEAEFATILYGEQSTSRQSMVLISLAAALAIGSALLVGYLGSRV